MTAAPRNDDKSSTTTPEPDLEKHLGLPDPPPRDDAKALPHDERLDTETAHAPERSPEERDD